MKGRISGETLVELMVAMAITGIILTTASMSFVNAAGGKNSNLVAIAFERSNSMLSEAKSTNRFINEDAEFDNMVLKMEVSKYGHSGLIYQIKISSFTKEGRPLVELQELIKLNTVAQWE